MRPHLRLLLAALLLLPGAAVAGRDPAEPAYHAAARAYYLLKSDAKARRFRHQWLAVAQQFEAVAARHPKSPRAKDALYTAGELLTELSRTSTLDADLAQAAADYQKVLELEPTHRLADDAALALGRIYAERMNQPELARKVLSRALASQPEGDQSGKLRALLAALPSAPSGPAPKVISARAPAPSSEPGRSLLAAIAKVQASPATKATAVLASASEDRKPRGKATEEAQESASEESKPRGKLKAAEVQIATARRASPTESPRSALTSASGMDARASVQRAGGLVPLRSRSLPAAEVDDDAPRGLALLRNLDFGGDDAADDAKAEDDAELTALQTRNPGVDAALAASQGGTLPKKGTRTPPVPKADVKLTAQRLRASGKVDPGVTLAQQLGLKFRRVVIDAGHGGHDTGAIGRSGVKEKDVTLAIARRVADQLADAGLDVVLTRDDDRFLRLEDRARLANEAKGDLFLSIHCNSAASKTLRGIETYTLNTASDRYSIRLAARENSSSERSISDLQFILADLATKANTDDSAQLAARVQRSLVTSLKSRYSGIQDLGQKEALFYVLLGARMPAILVETSFLSHPDEEARLASAGYQQDVARAISDGVREFLGARQAVASRADRKRR